MTINTWNLLCLDARLASRVMSVSGPSNQNQSSFSQIIQVNINYLVFIVVLNY